MDGLEMIFNRRSIRKFESTPVESDKIDLMLKAAMQAPSANNGQPWHFITIDDRQTLDQIPEFHPWSKMLYQAPLAIVVCAYVPEGKLYEMWIQDCSAATQNLLLAAHYLGVGSVWLGLHPRTERVQGIRTLLKLPKEIHPFSIIALGYPAEKVAPVDRFDINRIHHNSW
jgi:nitroreductase